MHHVAMFHSVKPMIGSSFPLSRDSHLSNHEIASPQFVDITQSLKKIVTLHRLAYDGS